MKKAKKETSRNVAVIGDQEFNKVEELRSQGDKKQASVIRVSAAKH